MPERLYDLFETWPIGRRVWPYYWQRGSIPVSMPAAMPVELCLNQRRAMACERVMKYSAYANVAVLMAGIGLAFLGVETAPVSYWLFDLYTLVFVCAAVLRLRCIAVFVAVNAEVRAPEGRFFLPKDVPDGFAQRLYTGANLAMWTCGWALLGSYFLAMMSIQPNSRTQASIPFLAACGSAGMFSLVFLFCIGVRVLLLFLNALGRVKVYDPSARVVAKAATDNKALPLLSFLRRASVLSAFASLPVASLLISAGAFPFEIRYWLHAAGFVLLAACGLVAVLCLLLRFVVIAVCFARYSIAHILGFNLALGLLLSLAVNLSEGWKAIPILALCVLVFAALWFVALQDPEGERYIPKFISERVHARRKELRARTRKS